MKRKIVFIVNLPPPINGATLMNKTLIESELIANSFKTHVIPFRFPKNISDYGTVSLRKIIKIFYYGFLLINSLIFFKPDIAYFTVSPSGVAFFRDVFYVSILKIFKVKILYHLHGKGIKDNAKSSRVMRKLYRYTFKNEHVICLSELLVCDIESVYNCTPYIVYDGIKNVYGDDKIKVHKDKKEVRILFLSHLNKSKGILVFLDALSLLNDHNVDYKARIVGDSADISIEELKKYSEDKNLNSKVDIVGPKYSTEKYLEFLNSDIFVFPTFYKPETFGLVVLEAMQFGLAVISTREGSLPVIVDEGKTGFLIEKKNPQELAEKIKILIDDAKLRKKMGKAGKEKFLKKFTLEKYEKNMLEVFHKVSAC